MQEGEKVLMRVEAIGEAAIRAGASSILLIPLRISELLSICPGGCRRRKGISPGRK